MACGSGLWPQQESPPPFLNSESRFTPHRSKRLQSLEPCVLKRHLATSLTALGWIWSNEVELSTLCCFWVVFVGTQVEMQAEKGT